MKKILMFGLYGVLILGASAGASWFLHSKQKAEIELANEPTDVPTQSPGQLASPVDVTRPLPDEAEDELPVAVRPGEMSVEEIVRYGLGLKDREALIREREESLQRTEAQHRLLLLDIDDEKMQIGGLMAQARDQRIASEKLLAQAQQERLQNDNSLKQLEEKIQKQDLEREKAARNPAESAGVEATEVDYPARIKEGAAMLAGLEPNNAASVLKDFANDGEMERAVELLATLEERPASEILNAIMTDDPTLGAEFVEQVVERRTTVKVAKKKR
jgi:hypothetical protein